jgi:hypothetical protein
MRQAHAVIMIRNEYAAPTVLDRNPAPYLRLLGVSQGVERSYGVAAQAAGDGGRHEFVPTPPHPSRLTPHGFPNWGKDGGDDVARSPGLSR